MRPLAVLAFGGNALLRSNQKGTYDEQFRNVEETCRQILPLIRWGYDIVICHGNGPQVQDQPRSPSDLSRLMDKTQE